jgi:hypothetical protein
MRVKLVASVLAAFFLLAAGAQAFQWHMSYGQAKNATKEFAEEACDKEKKCTGYGVGQCLRKSESRYDCEAGTFYAELPQPGEELECNILLHWGVGHTGILVLKNYGKPRCFAI